MSIASPAAMFQFEQSVGMTPPPELVQMFRGIRQDARNDPKPTETPQTFNIEFTFDGVGLQPTAGDTVVWSSGRLSARLIGVELVADAVGSAVIDLRMGTMSSWPTSVAPYDSIPTLSALAAAEIGVGNWSITSLQPFDVMSAKLVSVAAPITCVTLTLVYRRLKWPSVNPSLVDNAGETLITNAGASLILRN